MKHMKGKFFAALLVCLTVGLLAAPALARPKWVSFKYTKWNIEWDQRAAKYRVTFNVTYKNDSKDRLITAFFNKTMENLTCDVYVKAKHKRGVQILYNGSLVNEVEHKLRSIKISHFVLSDAVSEIEMYPGQLHTETYSFTLNNVSLPEIIGDEYVEDLNLSKLYVKNRKWYHDYHVKSRSMTDGKSYVD